MVHSHAVPGQHAAPSLDHIQQHCQVVMPHIRLLQDCLSSPFV
jgi:hypothetical protein